MNRIVLTVLLSIIYNFAYADGHRNGHHNYSRGHGYNHTGEIVAGLVGLGIVADIISDVCSPRETVRYVTPREVVYVTGRPVMRWIEGHYEYADFQIWVDQIVVEPIYEYRNGVYIVVREGYTIPGHYETKTVKRWMEGYWVNG
jgi:hypothetical protein